MTCTRRGGPFLALTWPYVAPSSLGLSDLTWSFFRSGFSPRGAPNPPFLSACARKWLRRPNMAAPSLSLRRKRVRTPAPFAVSNSRPFLAFSNASFVQFDSSNQEVFFGRPSSTIGTTVSPLLLLRRQKEGNLPFDCLSRTRRKGRLLVCSEITSVRRFGHLLDFCGNFFENSLSTIEFCFLQGCVKRHVLLFLAELIKNSTVKRIAL